MKVDIYRCAGAPEIYIAVPMHGSLPGQVYVQNRYVAAEGWDFLKTLDLQPDGTYVGIDPKQALADIETIGWHLDAAHLTRRGKDSC